MSFYIEIINQTIEYIEDKISEKISLEDISEHFSISKFHFNRMFKTVSGMTLKQYILGRKLTHAMNYLKETGAPVIDAAYEVGFDYPEVFSRAFKKHFGVTPSESRNGKINDYVVKKAKIVERDIINYKGMMTLCGTSIFYDELNLLGIYMEVDVNSQKFRPLMQATGERFLEESQKLSCLNHERVYAVVNCHEKDNGEYTVFYGMEAKCIDQETNFKTRIIPEGWYAKFIYDGDMFDIRETFIDDLYRWIIVKEVELNPNGIGMINVFKKDYLKERKVEIIIPIKKAL